MTTKSPVSYYGGKASMVSELLKQIPKHHIYIEPFFGSGALFFAKEPASSEIINDSNGLVINFYKQCKMNFKALKEKVESSLFSRATFKVANAVWTLPHLFSKLTQAWAFFVGCTQGFASSPHSWGFDKYGLRHKAVKNKIIKFDESIAQRLKDTTIECNDAVKVIEIWDDSSAFIYADPPYINTNCDFYTGYTEADYERLLISLSKGKGKFLLSSFPNNLLEKYTSKHGWHTKKLHKVKSASKAVKGKKRPRKIEVLTANYPLV